MADLVECATGELVEHRDPDRIDLDPSVAAAGGVAAGGTFGDDAFHSHGGGQDLERVSGLVDIGSDRSELQGGQPAARKLLKALTADAPALGAEGDSRDCQQVERGVGGRNRGRFAVGFGRAGDEPLL